MSQGWQYKVSECDEPLRHVQDEVAKWTAAGWELVSTCPKARGGGQTIKILLFWRRPTT
jgi:hypothetical protein